MPVKPSDFATPREFLEAKMRELIKNLKEAFERLPEGDLEPIDPERPPAVGRIRLVSPGGGKKPPMTALIVRETETGFVLAPMMNPDDWLDVDATADDVVVSRGESPFLLGWGDIGFYVRKGLKFEAPKKVVARWSDLGRIKDAAERFDSPSPVPVPNDENAQLWLALIGSLAP